MFASANASLVHPYQALLMAGAAAVYSPSYEQVLGAWGVYHAVRIARVYGMHVQSHAPSFMHQYCKRDDRSRQTFGAKSKQYMVTPTSSDVACSDLIRHATRV